MKALRARALYSSIAAAVLVVMAAPGMAQDAGPVSDIPSDLMADLNNSYIFVFEDSVRKIAVRGRANALARRHGGVVARVYTTAIRGFSVRMPAHAAARMAAQNREIAYYEADGLVRADGNNTNATSRGERYSRIPDGIPRAAAKPVIDNSESPQVVPSGIARVGGPVDGTGLTAWVLDTGIDLDHPDLNVDVARSAYFAKGRKTANDNNGHGTHVAGIIGALKNDVDVVGVAPGATLVPVRVLRRNGMGRVSGVIAGINYVAASALPGDVANLSLVAGASNALDDAVRGAADLGILFAIAAGNTGSDANNVSPARVEHANVYTVSAIDGNDDFASFSNWGNPPIEFAAPGVNVLSSAIDGGTVSMSGTSMATPHVAGVLLVTGGWPGSDGCAKGDPDGNRDHIVHIFGGAGFC